MRKTITLLIFTIIIFTNYNCASKRFTKKAQKLEDTGQYTEAANFYYDAFRKNRTNVEAFTGLKRTGQMALSKKLSEFNKAYNQQNNKEAIAYYQDAKAYYDKLYILDIELNFPAYYTDYYNEVKDIYLEDKYYEGVNLLENEKFSDAERVFNEIIRLNSSYKDSKDKLRTAVYEPKYRNGLIYLEQEKYRQAYYIFKDVAEKGNSYKDSFDLQKESLEKGTVRISIAPVKNSSSYNEINSPLENKITNSIQSQNNPFIKIMTNSLDSDLSLVCEITSYKYDQGSLKTSDKRGFLKKTVKVMNNETKNYENKVQYDKITYTEYSMSRSINMTISYKLINKRTNEIYKSDIKSFKANDALNYAKYDGNTDNIVPGHWESKSSSSPKDKVNDTSSAKRELQSLFSARTKIKDYNTLSTEIINSSSNTIGEAINSFIMEN